VVRVLAGALVTLGVLGALAVATSPVDAASAHHTTSASAAIAAPNAARLGPDSGTSTFVGFRDANMQGSTEILTGCGGHNFSFPAHSYIFSYEGQTVNMYNCKGERCDVNYTFHKSASSKTPVGWQSLFVSC
jgi:hypothetical protein